MFGRRDKLSGQLTMGYKNKSDHRAVICLFIIPIADLPIADYLHLKAMLPLFFDGGQAPIWFFLWDAKGVNRLGRSGHLPLENHDGG